MSKEAQTQLSKVIMDKDVKKLTEYLFKPGDLDTVKTHKMSVDGTAVNGKRVKAYVITWMRVNQPDKQDVMQLCPWWLEYVTTSPYLASKMPADDEIAKVDYVPRDPNDDLTWMDIMMPFEQTLIHEFSQSYLNGAGMSLDNEYKWKQCISLADGSKRCTNADSMSFFALGLNMIKHKGTRHTKEGNLERIKKRRPTSGAGTGIAKMAGMTCNQTGPFFARLPLEIRSEIYRYVLGGKTIHFARGRGDDPRPRHCVCLIRGRPSHLLVCRQGPAEEMYCHRASLPDGRGWQLTGEVQEEYPFRSRIPLLLTCRQIYSEAVILLASDNTINIQAQIVEQLQVVSEVRTFLPEKMFHAIRILELSFCLSNIVPQTHDLSDPSWFKHWTDMCMTLRDMQGLSSLHIWVNIDQEAPTGKVLTAENESQFFTPLLGQNWSQLRHFQVEVSWPATPKSDALLQNAIFTLVRIEHAESPWLIPTGILYV
ncbi:hypothetical protein CDV55_100964 [Aspergillus turcosus]|nr:hypothetical protein CDV55_100964 [Aspergillus turcosus]